MRVFVVLTIASIRIVVIQVQQSSWSAVRLGPLQLDDVMSTWIQIPHNLLLQILITRPVSIDPSSACEPNLPH
jgi:hypothetical protein